MKICSDQQSQRIPLQNQPLTISVIKSIWFALFKILLELLENIAYIYSQTNIANTNENKITLYISGD